MFKMSRRIHATLDYGVSSLIAALPLALDLPDDGPVAQALKRHSSISGTLSALTDYERGVVRVVPYRVHLALEALAVGVLIFGGMQPGGNDRRHRWIPFLLSGVIAAIVLLSLPGANEPAEDAV